MRADEEKGGASIEAGISLALAECGAGAMTKPDAAGAALGEG